jgi:hypothetical protein
MYRPIPVLSQKDIKRFWKYVKKGNPDKCWTWQASTHGKRNYYGQFSIGYKMFLASRVSYFVEHGTIDDSLEVCHSCDNPPCCNPNHLFQGTCSDNTKDAICKGRHNFQLYPELRPYGKTHHWHLHIRRGEELGCTKYTDQQVTEIRGLRLTGMSFDKIARRTGVSKSQVSRICKNQSRSLGSENPSL